jgi:hypothetical protein
MLDFRSFQSVFISRADAHSPVWLIFVRPFGKSYAHHDIMELFGNTAKEFD